MLGRGIYALGGDEISAKRAGFNVFGIKLFIYSYVGLIAGIGGIARASMMRNCHPTNLLGMEMTVIAAVVLGGTRVTGGLGTLTGTMLGMALMTIMSNSLIMLGIPTYWQKVFTGLIIIIGTGVSAYQVKQDRFPEEEELLGRPLIKEPQMKGTMKKFRINDANLLRLIIMFVLVFVVMSALKPDIFLRSWNLVSMMKQVPRIRNYGYRYKSGHDYRRYRPGCSRNSQPVCHHHRQIPDRHGTQGGSQLRGDSHANRVSLYRCGDGSRGGPDQWNPDQPLPHPRHPGDPGKRSSFLRGSPSF